MAFPSDLQRKHEAAFASAKRLPKCGLDSFWLACERAISLSVERGGITKELFLDLAAQQELSEEEWLYAAIGLCWAMEAQKAKSEDPGT